MPQPTASDVHVNTPLTNMSVAYLQSADKFIADKVFPVVPVQKQSDRYFTYDKGDWNRAIADKRAPSTPSIGSGYRVDNTPTYYAHVYAVHKNVDDYVRANADSPLNMDRDSTEWVTQNMLLKRDKVWAAQYFTTSIWGNTDQTGVTGSPAANQFKRWDVAGSTPIEDVTNKAITIAEQTGMRPNILVLHPKVYNALKNHADVLDRIKYTQRGIVTEDILAALFDVDKVLIAWAFENTALEGVTNSFSFIAGKHALLVYAAPGASLMKPSGGYTFAWTGLLGSGAQGVRIKKFRIEEIASDRIEAEMGFDMKLVSPDVGQLFASAVS